MAVSGTGYFHQHQGVACSSQYERIWRKYVDFCSWAGGARRSSKTDCIILSFLAKTSMGMGGVEGARGEVRLLFLFLLVFIFLCLRRGGVTASVNGGEIKHFIQKQMPVASGATVRRYASVNEDNLCSVSEAVLS